MFPETGWIKNPTKEVRELIISHLRNHRRNLPELGYDHIAWNGSDIWFVQKASNRQEYTNKFILQTFKQKEVEKAGTSYHESQGALGTNNRRKSVGITETQFGRWGEGLTTGDRRRRASIATFG